MTEGLQILLLGRPQIMQNNTPVFIFHKAQALFYYLAVTGRPHQRSALLNFLWSHIPENNRKNNLRVTLSYLRKHFGQYLSINRHTVSFNQNASYWLDVDVLKNVQSSPKTIERLQEIVKLYQGHFLEGFQVPEEREFEVWVLTTRKKLQDLVIQALHTLALRYKEQGNYTEGIECLNRLLSLQPWREESHQLLMSLLAISGQRSAALEQYEICRQLLEEYRRSPSAELIQLYEEIVAGKIVQPDAATLTAQTVGCFVENELQQQRHVEAERQVTVMYCHWHDIHAQLAQSPEVWHTLQQYCTQHLFGIIHHFGGQVVYQYNAGFLVAFGNTDKEGDNPQQAIQCGLKILESFDNTVKIQTHQLSIAVHTGLVLMEKVKVNGHHYLNLMGQPLEVVQELARRANPNVLLISGDTYSLVKETVTCQRYDNPEQNSVDMGIYQVQPARVTING
jgi:DNA-binding SARP family transcriptional activator